MLVSPFIQSYTYTFWKYGIQTKEQSTFYLDINILKGLGSKFSLLDLFQPLTDSLLLDLLVLLHDALLLPLFGLLAQTLLLCFANLLQLRFPLLQLLLLTLNVQALQALLALLDGLPTSQDARVILAGIFRIGSNGELVLLLTLLLRNEKNFFLNAALSWRIKERAKRH